MAETLYTGQDKRFLAALKAQGVDKDTAFAELAKQKQIRGQTNVAAPKFLQNAANEVASTGDHSKLSTSVPDIAQGVMTHVSKPEDTVGGTNNNPSTLKNIGQSILNVAAPFLNPQTLGLAANASGAGVGFVGNTIGTAFDVAKKGQELVPGGTNGEGLDKIGQFFKDTGNQFENTSKGIGADLGVDPNSPEAKVTRGTTKLLTGAALSAPVGGPVRAGVTEALGGGLGAKIAGNAAASIPETTVFTGGLEGSLPTKNEAGVGLAIDTLLPVVGTMARKGYQFGKKIVDAFRNGNLSPMAIDVANTVAKSDDATKEAFLKMGDQYEAYMKNPTKVSSPLADVGQKISDDFTNVILPEREAIGKELSAQIKEADNLAQAGGGQTSQQIVKTFVDGLDDIGVKATDTGLDFIDSTIRFSGDNQNALSKVYSNVKKFLKEGSYVPPSEKWALAQALDDLSEYNSKLASQTTTTGELPLVQLKNSLVQDIKNSLSESGQAVDLFDQYASLSKIRDVLNRRLGEGGAGGFSVTKSLFGEQKFGSEVKEALDAMNAKTGVDYLEEARRAKAAGEAIGDDQAKSLLTTTSAKGFVQKAAEDAIFDKTRIFERIRASLDKDKVKYSQPILEKIVSATVKALGANISN